MDLRASRRPRAGECQVASYIMIAFTARWSRQSRKSLHPRPRRGRGDFAPQRLGPSSRRREVRDPSAERAHHRRVHRSSLCDVAHAVPAGRGTTTPGRRASTASVLPAGSCMAVLRTAHARHSDPVNAARRFILREIRDKTWYHSWTLITSGMCALRPGFHGLWLASTYLLGCGQGDDDTRWAARQLSKRQRICSA